jgi:hypothetical protein
MSKNKEQQCNQSVRHGAVHGDKAEKVDRLEKDWAGLLVLC